MAVNSEPCERVDQPICLHLVAQPACKSALPIVLYKKLAVLERRRVIESEAHVRRHYLTEK
eukprot:scaffold22676_cov102-Cylindrotheca_fusiformis.AAC.1